MNEIYKGIASYNSLLRTQMNEFLKQRLKEVGKSELSPSHGALLYVVYAHGGKVQIKLIYDTLLKQKSTITEMIKRLVKLGYLTKETCCEDKRVTYVVATEKTMEFREDFDRISQELIDRVFADFTEEEKIEMTRLIQKSINNFI